MRQLPPDHGSHAAGSLCDALPPSSIVGFGEVAYRVLDTVMQALADFSAE